MWRYKVKTEEYQELLDKLFKQVYRDLKKRMFPRKHIKLIHGEIDIEAKHMDGPAIGLYENEEIRRFRYKHHIFVSVEIIEDYINAKWCKKYYKERIKKTIAHELVHAYVFEKHEDLIDIKNVHCDGSPLFLGILAYLNITSGHRTWSAFTRTDLYKQIKKCTNYDEVETLLIRTMLEYQRAIRLLEYIVDNNNKTIYHNEYLFSNGDITGVKGESTITFSEEGFLCKANAFIMGPYVDLSKLKYLTLKKINNNSFDKRYYGKMQCQTIEDKRDKLRLQSMNI
jgi:hypothetical protein